MALFGNGTKAATAPAQAPRTDYDDPFDQIAGSEARQTGVYAVEGVYPVLYVDCLKMIKSRKGDQIFIAEFDIVDSEVDERPPGTRMSWAANFRHDATPGNVKGFLAVLMGVDADDVDAASAKLAVSESNPCRGRLIRLEAVMIETKAGKPFTLHNWRTIPQEMQAQANELRANAGFPPF